MKNNPTGRDRFESELRRLEEENLLRGLSGLAEVEPPRITLGRNGNVLIDFASNDYLGLSHHPLMKQAASHAVMKWGTGSRASRLLSGDHPLYAILEQEIARMKGCETSLVFGSGYLVNTGIIQALSGKNRVIIADRLVHASIIDGIRLSGAEFRRFRHNDLDHLEKILREDQSCRPEDRLVVVEGVYSMDGDCADIAALLRLKKRYGFLLMVDEAHAVGILGENGTGIVDQGKAGKIDLIVGTFGKALGSYGAYCAMNVTMRRYLVNKARTLIFSTALPPAVLASSIEALRLLPKLQDERTRLLKNAMELREFIRSDLEMTSPGSTQILPIIVGSASRALSLQKFLGSRGIFAPAIRPPTVPKGSERIRFSITADHGKKEIKILKQALRDFFHT